MVIKKKCDKCGDKQPRQSTWHQLYLAMIPRIGIELVSKSDDDVLFKVGSQTHRHIYTTKCPICRDAAVRKLLLDLIK